MDLDQIYDELARGTTEPVDLSWTRRKLQLMALERAKSGTPQQRLGALRVAAVLGRRDGIAIVRELVRDPDPAVRTMAFRQAVEAHEQGLVAIRDAAGGADPAIAAEALDHLILWVDQAGLATARRALASADPSVRERAVRLLGHVGGPAVRVDLARLEADPVPAVREAVTEALGRLSGTIPRGQRTSWWTEDGATVAVDPAAPVGLAPPTPAWAADAAPVVPTPVEETTAAVPWRRVEVPEPPPEPPPWDGRTAALPAELPTETRALARLLGMVAPADRGAVLEALRTGPARAAEWSALLHAHLSARVSKDAAPTDPALAIGLLLAARLHGGPGHATPIRALLKDPRPPVRAAAVEALGALGTAAIVPTLGGLLADPEIPVKVAAVEAIAEVGRRTGRADLVRDVLGRARGDASLREVIDRVAGG